METITENKLKFDKCLGEWVNPYKNTKGILSFEIKKVEDEIIIKITGVEGGIKPGDWGEAVLTGYAPSADANLATAYKATFDLGFATATLAINENKGLLVVLAYINLKERGTQSDYFIREFYCKK